jgi:hypothetical protein
MRRGAAAPRGPPWHGQARPPDRASSRPSRPAHRGRAGGLTTTRCRPRGAPRAARPRRRPGGAPGGPLRLKAARGLTARTPTRGPCSGRSWARSASSGVWSARDPAPGRPPSEPHRARRPVHPRAPSEPPPTPIAATTRTRPSCPAGRHPAAWLRRSRPQASTPLHAGGQPAERWRRPYAAATSRTGPPAARTSASA